MCLMVPNVSVPGPGMRYAALIRWDARVSCRLFRRDRITIGQMAADAGTIVTALIAAAAGLGGVGIGSWMTRSTQETNWRRDRRFNAYADLIDAAGEFNVKSAEYFQAGANQPVLRPEWDRALYNLDRAATRVQLIGPKATRDVVEHLMDHAAGAIIPMTGHGVNPPTQQVQSALDDFIKRYEDFMKAGRKEFKAD